MDNKKLSDNEIIKALQCCTKTRKMGDCKAQGCPALTPHGCSYYLRTDDEFAGVIFVELIKEAIDLINRQKAEVERLLTEIHSLGLVQNGYNDLLEICKADAIKEFAERLKSTNLYEFIEEYYENAELCYEVRQDQFEEYCDNLVKEMVGDDDV